VVEPSSTSDSRLRGARPMLDERAARSPRSQMSAGSGTSAGSRATTKLDSASHLSKRFAAAALDGQAEIIVFPK
jgi:hypothetical protein